MAAAAGKRLPSFPQVYNQLEITRKNIRRDVATGKTMRNQAIVCASAGALACGYRLLGRELPGNPM